jgi:hypothetical protein
MPEKIRISSDPVVVGDPYCDEHASLQDEAIAMRRYGQTVEQPFEREADQQDVKNAASLRAMLSSRSLTDFAMLVGILAIGGERFEIGPHYFPSASGLCALGDCARSCLALLERSPQAFHRN